MLLKLKIMAAGLALAASPALVQAQAVSQAGETAKPAQTATQGAATPETVRTAFEGRFPGIQIKEVRPTPFPDLFEVQIGRDLVYTNATAEFVLQGALIDARNRRDLTAERMEELSKVAFDTLPLELAVQQVKGDGSRKIAVFEDPNCGYCKRLHQTLKQVDNITVYTFLFPILSPDSTEKARNIWCAEDQAATWRAWMLDGIVPPEAVCETPVEKVLALGRGMMVQGTPAIIFADGTRANGALPLDALNQRLAAVK
ncbi:DsbC family protein [Pusillimonas sp. MFBS29]|uniref:DsbC family protein n=1 Tax=Pusillimonas sp. MFBS29 TaxID=2886690 RepID=UPI001D108D4F|nr:DsbC family protein [Pusillimonas sp. MFBS29]MCC2595734.1 DsbC family protein [Pusillimonas sp. MFBS29]